MWQIYAAVAIAIAAASAWGGFKFEKDAWDEHDAMVANAAVHTMHKQATGVAKVETQYVHDIQTVTVPVDRIVTRLVRVCPAGVQQPAQGVPVSPGNSQQSADAATPADAGNGLLDNVAGELPACTLNGKQLDGLQALIRVYTPQPKK